MHTRVHVHKFNEEIKAFSNILTGSHRCWLSEVEISPDNENKCRLNGTAVGN